MKGFLSKLQRLGKALMLPIAVLPVAGLMLRLGQPDVFNIPILAQAGDSIFSNLPLLFAIGIAFGLSKDNHGAAALSGAVSYFVLNASAQAVNFALQAGTIFGVSAEVSKNFSKINMAHLGGIVAGIIAASMYNKFKDSKLPDWLGFFGGRRFVPIMTGASSLVLGAGLGVIWPTIQRGIDAFGRFMTSSSGIGEFLYGFFNRLLLPFGLHHVINSVVWFNFGEFNGAAGDLGRFFAQTASGQDPTAGMFMAGFFPMMMLGLPAAALAMYVCAKKESKAIVGGALFSVAFTAFLTGITEPIEFMFMFLAPVLYVVHAILTGILVAVCSILGIRHGFTFSAGAIDYFLNMGLSTRGWWLLVIGLITAVLYFLVFIFFIKKFNIKTPGREDDEESESFSSLISDKGISELATMYIEKLGGRDNIVEIDSCITRLRLVLKNTKIVDDKELKAIGASGTLRAGSTIMQVIIGTKAELLADEMKKLLKLIGV